MRTWLSMSRREWCLTVALVTALVPLAVWNAQGQQAPPIFVFDGKAIPAPLIGKGRVGIQEITIPGDEPIVEPKFNFSRNRSNSLCDGLTEAQKRLLTICARK